MDESMAEGSSVEEWLACVKRAVEEGDAGSAEHFLRKALEAQPIRRWEPRNTLIERDNRR